MALPRDIALLMEGLGSVLSFMARESEEVGAGVRSIVSQ